jgi:hypothetical protein
VPTRPATLMRQPGPATAQLRHVAGSSPKRVGPLATPATLDTTSMKTCQWRCGMEERARTCPRARWRLELRLRTQAGLHTMQAVAMGETLARNATTT